MNHPDPYGPPNLTPMEIGEMWENPVTCVRATIPERTGDNPEGCLTRHSEHHEKYQ